jgi:hypothetical protein
MDAALLETHHRLNTDLEFFAENAPFVIQAKNGQIIPFKLNTAQRYLHKRLEEQKRTKGWVRAVIIKGRQQGISTYLEARFSHKVFRSEGLSAFILTHAGDATDNLFSMTRRFYNNMLPALRPGREKDNPREMTFPGINSGFSAATAGNEDAGRSCTSQLVHWSEVAYCDNAYAIQDSMVQGVALIPGTEIVYESTAKGPSGLYYEMCKAAMRGEGDCIFIFIPWFWQEEYEREDDGSDLTLEEIAFKEAYFAKPFPFQQFPISEAKARRKLLWRRGKVFELAPLNAQVGMAKFRAIYPSNPTEAFLSTAIGEVRADAIVAARTLDRKIANDVMMPRLGGLDPAGEGKKADRSILAIRQGNLAIEKAYRFAGLNSMELVGRVARLMDQEGLDMLFVDNGYGKQMVDRLHELGFARRVIGVWFNQGADNENKYTNKRSEIILTAADFINAGNVSIPDTEEQQLDAHTWLCGGDEIHADLAAMPMHKETSEGKHSVVPREDLIRLFGQSFDIFSAFALTFSFPVHTPLSQQNNWRRADLSATVGNVNGRGRNNGSGGLRSLMRKRGIGQSA